MKIGIPRGLFYYYHKDIWINFFEYLSIPYIISPKTNKEIIDLGIKYSTDEMCLSMKLYLGHVMYLKDKCDYLLVPRINNYHTNNQMCTNFMASYDIINNLTNMKILNYNIDLSNFETLKIGMINIGKNLGYNYIRSLKAYNYGINRYKVINQKRIQNNEKNLNSEGIKILLVSHAYNLYDEYGKEITNYFLKRNIKIIFSDAFNEKEVNKLSKKLAPDLYFYYSKNNLGSIVKALNKINGIIFLSSFPCNLDSLSNEMAMRKINKPFINLIIDNNFSSAGLETRLESFADMLEGVYE